jgi:hypothetical protein
MKKDGQLFRMMISSIVMSSCFIISFDIISNADQVSGESTAPSVPQDTEQSANKTTLQAFTDSLRGLVSKSTELTGKYQLELGKWATREIDNLTMIAITDKYLPKFKDLENEASNLAVPFGQENIKESFIKSISSESSSYAHFRNYLISGNITENEISNDEFSLAFQYEQVYAAFLLKNR